VFKRKKPAPRDALPIDGEPIGAGDGGDEKPRVEYSPIKGEAITETARLKTSGDNDFTRIV
jgi:hypothetical protein